MDQQPSILKEVRPHGTKSFPCAIYRTHSVGKGTLVKHHWHDEAEILYFSGGEFRLEINMESFPVCSECLYFINPGELHSIERLMLKSHNSVFFNHITVRLTNSMSLKCIIERARKYWRR